MGRRQARRTITAFDKIVKTNLSMHNRTEAALVGILFQKFQTYDRYDLKVKMKGFPNLL